jgi:hypothetical protein
LLLLLLLLLPAGTRYASGAVLRVLRSYPGSWTAHVVSSDGASQVRCSVVHRIIFSRWRGQQLASPVAPPPCH